MAVNLEYEKINYKKEKYQLESQVKVSAKSNISNETVKKVLIINSKVETRPNNETTFKDKLLVSGVVSYYVCYIDTENEVKKVELNANFNSEIKCEQADSIKYEITADILKTESISNSIMLEFESIVNVKISTYETQSISPVVKGENLIDNQEEKEVTRYLGKKQIVLPVAEEIELNYEVKEVLSQNAEVVIKNATCGVNSVIVEGDIILSAILLQNGDKIDIIKEYKTLPFRGEVDNFEVSPEMYAEARAKVKSFRTDISAYGDKRISVVNAEVMLMIETEVYEKAQILVMQDAFSLKQDIQLKRVEVGIDRERTQNIKGDIVIKTEVIDLPFGGVLKAPSNEKVEIISSEKRQDELEVNGVVSANLIFCMDEEYFTKRVEVPFSKELACSTQCGKCKIQVVVLSSRARLISQNESEIELECIFIITDIENEKVSFVSDVIEMGEKENYTHPLSVYIGQKNESKWSLSKRLNISPEELDKTNKDLVFPLNGTERVVIYRQRTKENK